MVSYLNVHDALEQRRRASREAGTSDRPGPRTIVRPLHDSCIATVSGHVWCPAAVRSEAMLPIPHGKACPSGQHAGAVQVRGRRC